MCIQDQKCCAFLSLHSMGIPTQGCLYDSTWIRSIELPVSPSATCFMSLPHRTITFRQTIAQGSFGFIDRAHYEEEKKDLYVKRPIRPGKKLLLEACVQQLVGELLTRLASSRPCGAGDLPSSRSVRGVCDGGDGTCDDAPRVFRWIGGSRVCPCRPRVYSSTMRYDVAITPFSWNEPPRRQAEQSYDSSEHRSPHYSGRT